jgi:hypothetical protein
MPADPSPPSADRNDNANGYKGAARHAIVKLLWCAAPLFSPPGVNRHSDEGGICLPSPPSHSDEGGICWIWRFVDMICRISNFHFQISISPSSPSPASPAPNNHQTTDKCYRLFCRCTSRRARVFRASSHPSLRKYHSTQIFLRPSGRR